MTSTTADQQARLRGKHISFLLNSFPNPSETFIADEIDCLHRLGCQVAVYSLTRPQHTLVHTSAQRLLDAGCVTYLEEPTRAAKLIGLLRLLIQPGALWRWWRCATPRWRKLNALAYRTALALPKGSHLHCHYAADSAQIAYVINACDGTPFSITTHGYDVFFEPPDNYPQLADAATCLFTISDFNRNHLLREQGLPPEKVVTMRCGIDLDAFTRLTLTPLADGETARLLTVARLHPVKGHRYLLTALAQLCAQAQRPIELTLVGEGALRSELEQQARELGLTDRITFYGAGDKTDVLTQLQHSHLFVLPSLSEGIPISMMEAMAARTPVIGPDVNGVSELLSAPEEGRLFEPGNSDSLAQAIEALLTHPEHFSRVTDAALEKVQRLHDLTTNTLAKYASLLAR